MNTGLSKKVCSKKGKGKVVESVVCGAAFEAEVVLSVPNASPRDLTQDRRSNIRLPDPEP